MVTLLKKTCREKKKAEMMYKWKIPSTIVIDPYHTLPFCLLEEETCRF